MSLDLMAFLSRDEKELLLKNNEALWGELRSHCIYTKLMSACSWAQLFDLLLLFDEPEPALVYIGQFCVLPYQCQCFNYCSLLLLGRSSTWSVLEEQQALLTSSTRLSLKDFGNWLSLSCWGYCVAQKALDELYGSCVDVRCKISVFNPYPPYIDVLDSRFYSQLFSPRLTLTTYFRTSLNHQPTYRMSMSTLVKSDIPRFGTRDSHSFGEAKLRVAGVLSDSQGRRHSREILFPGELPEIEEVESNQTEVGFRS